MKKQKIWRVLQKRNCLQRLMLQATGYMKNRFRAVFLVKRLQNFQIQVVK